MKLSTEIKRYFKALGIEVRVKTGTSKHPFISAWIDRENAINFPLEIRQKLLRIIYGANCTFAESGNAGNVMVKSLACHEKEWRELLVD